MSADASRPRVAEGLGWPAVGPELNRSSGALGWPDRMTPPQPASQPDEAVGAFVDIEPQNDADNSDQGDSVPAAPASGSLAPDPAVSRETVDLETDDSLARTGVGRHASPDSAPSTEAADDETPRSAPGATPDATPQPSTERAPEVPEPAPERVSDELTARGTVTASDDATDPATLDASDASDAAGTVPAAAPEETAHVTDGTPLVTSTGTASAVSPFGAPADTAPGGSPGEPVEWAPSEATRETPDLPAPAPAATSPRIRTAAEIAAAPSPSALGGFDHDTPLATAADMAIRARGISRSLTLPRPARTRVMIVANQKGGVGKTTTAVNVAAALALHGARVLLVDLDPQGNASTALGVEHHADVVSMYDVLVRGEPMSAVIQPAVGVPNLWCAPATIDLSGAEVELVSFVAREGRLRRALEQHLGERERQGDARYDYVLVDCPPSLGLLTVNALAAGAEVFIPIQCEYYALEGVSQLVKIVELVRSQLNPALTITTVLLTMYDARTRLSSQVADEVRSHFGPAVLATAIPRSVRISEAPSYSQTVMTYDPGSTGALSYLEAARELAAAGVRDDAVAQHDSTREQR